MPGLYRLPFEMCQHRDHAAGVPITVCDIPGCSALDHLDLVNVVLGVGTPDRGTIL